MSLVEFLLARIQEDEDVARAALHEDAVRPGTWTAEHHNSEYPTEPNRAHIAEDRSGHYWSVAHEVFIPIAEHIARHDPARVLAECAAKRRIVERDRNQESYIFAGPGEPPTRKGGTDTLRVLALPYADHPDYQEEWHA